MMVRYFPRSRPICRCLFLTPLSDLNIQGILQEQELELTLEAACLMDAMELFVKATYEVPVRRDQNRFCALQHLAVCLSSRVTRASQARLCPASCGVWVTTFQQLRSRKCIPNVKALAAKAASHLEGDEFLMFVAHQIATVMRKVELLSRTTNRGECATA